MWQCRGHMHGHSSGVGSVGHSALRYCTVAGHHSALTVLLGLLGSFLCINSHDETL